MFSFLLDFVPQAASSSSIPKEEGSAVELQIMDADSPRPTPSNGGETKAAAAPNRRWSIQSPRRQRTVAASGVIKLKPKEAKTFG